MTRIGATKAWGVTASFANGWSVHFPGAEGLADACAWADRHGTKVCTFSTPETIARDLRGTRARDVTGTTRYLKREPLPYDSPEERMLRGARRLDLFQRPTVRPRWWPLRVFGKGRDV